MTSPSETLELALEPLWRQCPDPLGPHSRKSRESEAGHQERPSATALLHALKGFTAEDQVPDEHLWNVVFGLTACLDSDVRFNDAHLLPSFDVSREHGGDSFPTVDGNVGQNVDGLRRMCRSALDSICKASPPRDLVKLIIWQMPHTRSMSSRITITALACSALCRFQRRRAPFVDDFLCSYRKYVQQPFLGYSKILCSDDSDEHDRGAHGETRNGRSIHQTTSLEFSGVVAPPGVSGTFFSIVHAANTLQSLISGNVLKPGTSVRGEHIEGEQCRLQAIVVNFALMSLEDLALHIDCPILEHTAGGQAFGSVRTKVDAVHAKSSQVISCIHKSVYRLIWIVLKNGPPMLELLLVASDSMPWIHRTGQLSSTLGSIATRGLTPGQKEQDARACERSAELDSESETDPSDSDSDSENELRHSGQLHECFLGSAVFGRVCALARMKIGGKPPSILGLAMLVSAGFSGIASLAPIWTIPRILSPKHMMRLCIPHIVCLLSHKGILATDRGIELFDFLVHRNQLYSASKSNFSEESSTMEEWPPKDLIALCQACIAFVVSCPDHTRQARVWHIFAKFMAAQGSGLRFSILRTLVANCPHNNIVGMLIDMLGNTAISPSSGKFLKRGCGTECDVIIRNELVVLIWRLWDRAMEADDVLEVAEVYMSLLTVLRRILLNDDPATNFFGLWPNIAHSKRNVISSLRSQVQAKVDARNFDICRLGEDFHSERLRQELLGEVSRLEMISHIANLVLEAVNDKEEAWNRRT